MYYLIEISTRGDKVNKQIYSYNLREDAIATYHKKLGGAMENPETIDAMYMVMDDKGGIIIHEYYKKPEEV